MEREEAIATAIATLENIKQFGIDKWMFDKEEIEAFDMAIKALSAMTDGDLISRQDAIRWVKTECNPYGKPTLDFESGKRVIEHLEQMQSAEPKTDEEDELKFYYVESIDDYWIGARLDNFYYADWHEGLGFVWSHSRYLPWGEHIVDENTLWKEHTYPSEPIEIPFTEWIVGFVKKYFTEPRSGEWVEKEVMVDEDTNITEWQSAKCSACGKYHTTPYMYYFDSFNYCPNCGAKMGSG